MPRERNTICGMPSTSARSRASLSRSASSVLRRSVTSWPIFRNPRRPPFRPRSAVVLPSMNTRVPSLRRCQRTFGAVPSLRAVSTSSRSTWPARSSGVNRMALGWSTASSALHPKTASAPGNQSVIRSSASVTKIA